MARKGKISKRSIVLSDTSAHTLGLGTQYARLLTMKLLSSSDTTVSLAVADGDSVTVGTFASTDYTTATEFNVAAEGATSKGRGAHVTEDGTAGTANVGLPLIAKSPLTLTASGLGAGTLTVTILVEG